MSLTQLKKPQTIDLKEQTKQSVFVETYGCQMNVYDTELIKTILKKDNFKVVERMEEASVIMLNTCSVRDKANRSIYNRVHTLKQIHPSPKGLKIGILGCMATNFRKDLLEDRSINIDFIAGPDSYKSLPTLITQSYETQKRKKPFDVTLSEFETYEDVYPTRSEGVNAWIAIMRGCNNYCTFCVVPLTRGRERSRTITSVVDEVKRLVDDGFQQVTLLGQNVNSYNSEQSNFTDLMDAVSQVDGLKRIRFTSPHPKDFPIPLLELMAERDNICKQIHLPLQAGNSRVLEMMNRTYTKEGFLDIAAQIKTIIPNVALSTDIIVGFPTETPEEFEDTLDVVKQVKFDSAFMFNYSERKGTRAYHRFKDDIPADEKTRRIVQLNDTQRAISLVKNQDHIGQTQRILVEETKTKKSDGKIMGRLDNNKRVLFEPNSKPVQLGDWLDITITGATSNSLFGELH